MKTSIITLVCIFTVAVAFLSCDFGTNNSNMQSNSSSSFEPQCDGTDLSLYGYGNPCGCVLPTIFIKTEQCGDEYILIGEYERCENGVVERRCGDEWYNTKTQFCYEYNVFDKCDGEIYYPPDQICENNVIHIPNVPPQPTSP